MQHMMLVGVDSFADFHAANFVLHVTRQKISEIVWLVSFFRSYGEHVGYELCRPAGLMTFHSTLYDFEAIYLQCIMC